MMRGIALLALSGATATVSAMSLTLDQPSLPHTDDAPNDESSFVRLPLEYTKHRWTERWVGE